MKNKYIPALIFVLSLVAAFITVGQQHQANAKNRFNPGAYLHGQCNSPVLVDQSFCAGGSKLCTIEGVSPVFPSSVDCRNNTNPMKFE